MKRNEEEIALLLRQLNRKETPQGKTAKYLGTHFGRRQI